MRPKATAHLGTCTQCAGQGDVIGGEDMGCISLPWLGAVGELGGAGHLCTGNGEAAGADVKAMGPGAAGMMARGGQRKLTRLSVVKTVAAGTGAAAGRTGSCIGHQDRI